MHPIPEDEETTEDQRERIQELNEEIEKTNELFAKLKQFVSLEIPSSDSSQAEEEKKDTSEVVEEEPAEEKGLVKIMNYREPVLPDASVEGQPAANQSTLSKDHHVSRTSAAVIGDGDQNSKMDTVSESSS